MQLVKWAKWVPVNKDRTYQRARTEEQKNQRLADILSTTEELLDERHYREITLTSIADRLGFSRANLSHYVRSKEEILLLLYVRSLEEMLAEMKCLCATGFGDSVANDSKHLAALVARHTDFGRIGAVLASLIESNVSLECLISCKKRIVEAMSEASTILVECGLFREHRDATEFLIDLSNYVSGLYPASHPLPIQVKASREAGYPIRGYEDSLVRYIAVQLAGYQALCFQP